VSTVNDQTIVGLDGDRATVTGDVSDGYDGRIVAWLNASSLPLDREGAVRVIDALTVFVAAKDAEVKRLKAGDKVTGSIRPDVLFVVITDENAEGRVDLVKLRNGEILRNRPASSFRRQSSGAYVPRRSPAPF
jgi:DNA-binding beta-propeller fold protein YncE